MMITIMMMMMMMMMMIIIIIITSGARHNKPRPARMIYYVGFDLARP